MGFIRVLVKAGSVGFVETAVEHVCLFFVAKKAGAQRFVIDARATNGIFSTFLLVRCSLGKGSVMSNPSERQRTLRTGLWVQRM